jgi:outer membrane lipopolysaccharide assembly protein LptE/RlpB
MYRAVLLSCFLLLTACGFRLQGRQSLPAELSTVQLIAADSHSDFTAALLRSLDASGVRVVDHVADDGAIVRIVRDEATEHVLSVDARNIPTDYELVYKVEVAVSAGGKELMAPQPFELSRIFSFDETRKLSKEREKDTLRQALARDMASVVLRRLSSL